MTFRNLACGIFLCGLFATACGGDDRPGAISEGGTSNNGGSNYGGFFNLGGHGGSSGASGNTSNGGNGVDAGLDASFDAGPDSSVGPIPDTDAGSTTRYTVPVGGGTLTFNTSSGSAISFEFPQSAIGETIIFTRSTSEAIGWPAGTFASVIKMEPDGLEFDPPVRVSLADGSLMLLNFPSSAIQSAPEPLELTTDGQVLELTHFSSLAIVAPGQSCQAQSGWTDSAGSQLCNNANGGKTTYRSYACQSHVFCHEIAASCCVVPGAAPTGCHTGDTNLTLTYTRTNTDGGQYPYCALPTVDAGPDGGVIAPYLQDYSPQTLIAGGGDQLLTLYGTHFAQGGTIFVNTDMALATTWVSEGEVSSLVTAQYLANAGFLSSVGYVNPLQAGGFDWVNRSNMVNIPIVAATADAGAVDASAPDASLGDAGAGVSDASSPTDASAALPVVTSFLPATLPSNQGDQVVTLYGSNFDVDGTGFYWLDFAAVTTWVSAGEAQLLIPESSLQQAAQQGSLNDVGYVGPAQAGGFDWPNRSNTIDIPIIDVAADAGDAGN